MPTPTDEAAPAAELERLYGVTPDAFVAARADAVKELRSQGRRDAAAAVGRLRKPTVAAWVVNRVARDEPDLVRELLAAGARLGDVQRSAGSPQDLRAAIVAEAAAVDALVRAAAALAGSGGAAETTLARVRETFHAAALDPELGEDVRRGVVAHEQQAVGFPAGLAVPAQRARPAARRPRGKQKATRPQVVDAVAAKRRERAAAAAERAGAQLATAQAALGEAESGLRNAERAAERARKAVDAASAAHEDAGRRAAEASEHLRELEGRG
ncbi:MAG TPA: hypothetical protein VGL44_00180 [Gaiellales bacterium]